ncbi:MAG: hypothetical protein IJU50_07005 [Lachnospiraceae bacterium]|nr:hypothetical protein [Lachnospiraceae bacterium]
MVGVYRLAGMTVQIESVCSLVQDQCRAYRVCGSPDLTVATTQADIGFEREKSAREDSAQGIPIRQFSDAYLETLAVYRKIAEKLPEFGTFLFHGSCIAVDGAGYLFTAKSGTGKSTHARLWRELLGNRAVMVNDDKPLLHVNGDGTAIAYGTPWDGKHRLSSNIAVPLKAICILERSVENTIREITKQDALPLLIQQAYRPADPAALAKTLALIDRLNVGFYRLSCNMDISAAELSYETMKNYNTSECVPVRERIK